MDMKKSKEQTEMCNRSFLPMAGIARDKEERYLVQKLNVLTTRQ